MKHKYEPFDDIIGRQKDSLREIPEDIIIPDIKDINSEVDKEIAVLLALHPQIKAKFRKNKLSSLSEEDKKEFLRTIQTLLDIEPLDND